GYKLGTTKSSKEKGEDLEKYITEQLQTTYNGTDDISKITHVGTKADISHIIHTNGQTQGQIIYEIKNEAK
ncbi:5526_t:CDS:1, partial [Ambispora leptoticha]